MRKRIFALLLAATLLLLGGCSMRTADQMYALPKRSRQQDALQTQIDTAMKDMAYCAPLTGENRQTVQKADLNGDGIQEYLVFAKAANERPLRIHIFSQQGDKMRLWDTVESNGTAFELVEYVDMDDVPGVELVVGCQLSDQLMRSVSVYHFPKGKAQRLMTTNYNKFLTIDLDGDSFKELFVLRPGQTETDNAVAELYGMENGSIQRSNEVNMSTPPDKLKRILSGRLDDGVTAVYAAAAVDDTTLVTDVFVMLNGSLLNVSIPGRTARNYYVYAEDIDSDGVVELPSLIPMLTFGESHSQERHDLIRWYSLQSNGSETDKMYTYHNFVDGWYLQLQPDWANRLTVIAQGNQHEFYLWNYSFDAVQKLMTLTVLTGQDREEESTAEGRIVLLKTDTAIYAANLESDSETFGITEENVLSRFHLIQQDWIGS